MRLSKAQERRREELVAELAAAAKSVEDHFALLLNVTLPAVCGPVNVSIGRYNAALLKASAFAEEVSSELRDDFDGKSERWQESDAGREAEDFISEWEGFDADKLPEIAIVDPELEEKPCHAKTLEELPSESQQ